MLPGKIDREKTYYKITNAVYCSEYFNKWFDKRFFPAESYWYLKEYCQKYKHIWE